MLILLEERLLAETLLTCEALQRDHWGMRIKYKRMSDAHIVPRQLKSLRIAVNRGDYGSRGVPSAQPPALRGLIHR